MREKQPAVEADVVAPPDPVGNDMAKLELLDPDSYMEGCEDLMPSTSATATSASACAAPPGGPRKGQVCPCGYVGTLAGRCRGCGWDLRWGAWPGWHSIYKDKGKYKGKKKEKKDFQGKDKWSERY